MLIDSWVTMKKQWTVIEVINRGTEYLSNKNIESPRLNIELLLSDMMNISRLEIYTQFDKPLTEEEVDIINHRCQRRSKREPLQYIIGRHQFIDLNLKIDKRALIPRPETELLADLASKWLFDKKIDADVLDIGTGSGCIALYLAKKSPRSNIVGLDYSEDSIALAKENAIINAIDNVQFYQTDILKVQPKKKYDLVVSNPPYISEKDYAELESELFFEPKIALSDGGDGFGFYRRFTELFDNIIKPNGSFIIEIGFGQEKEIIGMFENTSFDIELIEDYSGKFRFILGLKNFSN